MPQNRIQIQALDNLVRQSDKSNFEQALPSELQQSITVFNDYAAVLRYLYDLSESTTGEVQDKKYDLLDLSNFTDPPAANASKEAKKKHKSAKKALDMYKSYSEDMIAIDQNGRLKSQAAKQFFMNNLRFWRQKRLASTLSQAFEMTDRGFGKEYASVAEGSDDKTKLEHFSDCIQYSNKIQFLVGATKLFSNIEDLKQLRDRRMAIDAGNSGGYDDVTQDENQQVYSYGGHNSFISADRINDELLSTSATIQAYETKKKQPRPKKSNKQEREQYDKDLAEAKEAAEKAQKKQAHLSHIAAEKALEEHIRHSDLDLINQNTVLSYMAFDPAVYLKAIAAPNADVETISDVRAQATDVESAASTYGEEADYSGDVHWIREIVKDQALDLPGNLESTCDFVMNTTIPTLTKFINPDSLLAKAGGQTDDFLENLPDNAEDADEFFSVSAEEVTDDMKGISKGELKGALQYDGASSVVGGVLGVIQCVIDFVKLVKQGKECTDARQRGDFVESVLLGLDAFNQACELLNNITDKVLKITSGVYKITAGLGGCALETAANACNIMGYVGNGMGLLTGSLQTIKSVVELGVRAHAAKKANNAKKKLLDDPEMKKNVRAKRNAQFLMRAASSQKRQAIQAGFDTVSGIANVTAGALAFVPGANIAATAIGLAASGASLIAKLALNAYFRKKDAKEGFASAIGYTMSQYDYLMKQMGGKSDVRTHNVMRRTIGIATRDDYSKTLAITNAIDLFAGARAYKLLNPDLKPKDKTQEAIKITMEGAGFNDPAKYDKVSLKDIFKKVDAPDDWRSVLRGAISHNTDFNIKEDISANQAAKVASGAYDNGGAISVATTYFNPIIGDTGA